MALVACFEFDDQVRVLPHHFHDALLHLERQLRELRIVFAFFAGFVIATNLSKKNVWNLVFKTCDQLDQPIKTCDQLDQPTKFNQLLVRQKQLV